MSTQSLKGQIRGNRTKVFRKLYIKRRNKSDGLFESDWLEITKRVKKWGSITNQIDPARPNKIVFQGLRITVDNFGGEFNSENDVGSLWDGFLTRQRSLVKVEAGFVHQTQSSSGIWSSTEFPNALWDVAIWDASLAVWDAELTKQVYTGILWGDLPTSDDNEVNLNITPLMQVFRDYPASLLTGYNDSLTASEFMELVRDHTDGSGSFVFQPFFGDTTANWLITSTTAIYPALSTSTGEDIRDSTVLEIMERLAEAENFVVYIDKTGNFRFNSRDATSTASWNFYGKGFVNNEYGHTIKKITEFGEKISTFYTRVRVKYQEEDTSTSFYEKSANFSVSPLSTGWQYGLKTLDIDNVWIQNASTAQDIGDALFLELSSLKREIKFTTSLVPHLNVLDRVTINYDSQEAAPIESTWDLRNWTPASEEELFWDSTNGDAISLSGIEFKLLKVKINLDKLECEFTAKEI